jgi:hypothetical protein
MTPILTTALRDLLDETFDNVRGYYLDRGTSLFETLATISAAEASIPVGGKCATLAAQVKHVTFYLDVYANSVRDPKAPPADWGYIWRTVGSVTPQEWEQIKTDLRDSYDRILDLLAEAPEWTAATEVGEAISVVVHTAYHLGEIRQALCTLKP